MPPAACINEESCTGIWRPKMCCPGSQSERLVSRSWTREIFILDIYGRTSPSEMKISSVKLFVWLCMDHLTSAGAILSWINLLFSKVQPQWRDQSLWLWHLASGLWPGTGNSCHFCSEIWRSEWVAMNFGPFPASWHPNVTVLVGKHFRCFYHSRSLVKLDARMMTWALFLPRPFDMFCKWGLLSFQFLYVCVILCLDLCAYSIATQNWATSLSAFNLTFEMAGW